MTLGKILSIVPYVNGYCGAVVVDCSAVPPHVVDALSIPTSVLVDLPEGSGRLNKKRELDPLVTEQLKDSIAAMVEGYRPDRTLLELPKAASLLQSAITEAIQSVLGEQHEPVSSLWRRGIGELPLRRENARRSVAGSFAEGALERLTYDSTLFAAALASNVLFGAPEDIVTRRERKPLELPVPGPVERPAAPNEPCFDWRKLPTEEPAEPTYPAPTSAGIDPGSRYVALAIGEGERAPLALRMLHTFEAGEVVQLAKPKIVQLALGGSYTITTKRVLTTANVRRLAQEVVAAMVARNVKRLTIEHVDDAHFSDGNVEAASAIATHLIRNMWVETEIAVRSEQAGIEVVRVGASTWRAKVAGSASAGADRDERIPIALREGYSNWPRETNEHERDAGGILLHGALPESVTKLRERNARVPVSAGRKRSKMSDLSDEAKEARRARDREASARRKEERHAARAKAGCRCEGKRHLGSCPLAKRNAKVTEYLEANP